MKFILLLVLFSLNLSADMNQFLPGMYGAENEDIEAIRKYHPKSVEEASEMDPFITFEEDKNLVEDLDDNGFDLISEPIDISENIDAKTKKNIKGASLPGDYEKFPQYLEFDNRKVLDEYQYDGKERLTLGIMYDSFDYNNSARSFDRVYRDSAKADVYGIFTFGYDYLIFGEDLKFFVGGGGGFGYNGGKGVFEGEDLANESTYSERTQISLYSIPMDLRLTLEIPFTRYFAIRATGGPSMLFMQEHRNDKEEGEEKRDRRQFGFGYYGVGALKVQLGYIYKDLGYKYLSTDFVSRFAMDIFGRYQNYRFLKNKAKGVSVKGLSFGIGFSYDFI